MATTNPRAAADAWLASIDLEAAAALFVVAFGEGHVLDALDRRGWRGHVVALEPDATKASRRLARDVVREWQAAGRLSILAGPDYAGLDEVVAALPLTTESPAITGDPEILRTSREQCAQAVRAVTRAWFGARANAEARTQNAGRYLLNTLRNLNTIAREGDAAALASLFAGVPAVVIGAGPSLDRNLADLGRFHDRAILVAADTALRPMLAAGVAPHFVVATDPTETNARHLGDLPACDETWLVAEGSIDPESFAHFAGRTFVFRVADHHPWPWLRASGHDRGHLRAWGSVLTTAFDLALKMGNDPIVFAGADLAFTGGRPYARGTTYEEVWRHAELWGQSIEDYWSATLAGWPDVQEPGVGGALVRTAPHLVSFRDWIASEAAAATGRSIVNATGGGILVGASVAQRPLAEVLETLPLLDSTAIGAGVAAAHARTATQGRARANDPEPATLAAWQTFGGAAIHRDSVERALGRVPPASVATPPMLTPSAATPSTDAEPPVTPGEVVFDCLPGMDLAAAIEAAWRGLAPADHRLVLRDRTGSPAGAAVRRALFAFVERHPDVTARFGRFFDPRDDRSWLDRRPPAVLFPGDDREKWLDHHAGVANRLTSLIVERLAPRSVLDVGCGAGHWLQALTAHGVEDVAGVETDLDRFTPWRSYDVCLCLGVVQSLPGAAADAVIAACTTASDTVVFAVPAAAIGAPGFLSERPAGAWAQVFAQHGFAAHDELRPTIEDRWGGYQTSFDLLTVYRRVVPAGESLPAPVRAALVAATGRIDDLVLQLLVTAKAAEPAHRAPEHAMRPRVAMVTLDLPPARLAATAEDSCRRFQFRTAAAALAIAADLDSLSVSEDGRPLRAVASPAIVEAGAPGSFAVHQGVITFRSCDGTDPRRNGRRYAVTVPSHVAWLERQPLAVILEHRL